jgi:transglutaminase-like putative cysteine protease
MKKLLTLALVLILAFTMTSCEIVFSILDAFLSEDTEKVAVDVLPDTDRVKDPQNPYSHLHSGYNFTPASHDGYIWEVYDYSEIDRVFDEAIANCRSEVTIDFKRVMGGFSDIDSFFKNGYLTNTQKELHYINSYKYTYEGTIATFTLKYNKNVASFVLDETTENDYKNYKNGNMILRDKFDGNPTRSANFDNFAINKNNKGTMAVYNSEALWWALEHNYLPTFPEKNTKAEAFYNEAKDILREIINDDMTDYEKTLAIFEYLVDRVDYDYDAFDAPFTDGSNDNVCYYLEGVFEYNRAVCDGKSKAFVLLCRIEGIEALRDWGDSYTGGAGHAWNYVKLDGTWYMVDTTAGDGGVFFKEIGEKAEIVNYSYFLCDVNSYKMGVASDKPYKYSGVWDEVIKINGDISDEYFTKVKLASNYDFRVNTYDELNYLVDTLADEMMDYNGKYTLNFTADNAYNVDTVARYLVEATKDEGIEFDLYDYIEKYGFYMVVFKKAAA